MDSPSATQSAARHRPRRRGRAPFIFLGLGVLIALGLLAMGGLMLWFRSYLHGDSFPKFLAAKLSAVLHADAEFQRFQWTGSSVYTDSFAATGRDGAAFTQLRADQLRADFNLRGVFDGAWQVDQVNVQHLQATLGGPGREQAEIPLRPGQPTGAPSQPEPAEKFRQWKLEAPSWVPRRLEWRKAIVNELDLAWGRAPDSNGTLKGTRLEAAPDGNAWTFVATGGSVQQGEWPKFSVDHARARFQDSRLFLNETELHDSNRGIVNISGEMNFVDGTQMDLRTQFSDVKVTPLLPEDWRVRLKGNLNGEAKITMNTAQPGSLKVSGKVHLTNGELEALPVLDQIAAFTQTAQFRHLSLQKASADITYDSTELAASRVVIESAGLIRIEGGFTVRGEKIDGLFQVGVTPSSLRWLPGAQDRVFTTAHDGYLWTPMKVTGKAKNPKEDLSNRLLIAAGNTVIEKGKELIEDMTKGKAKDLLDFIFPK